MGNRRTDRLTTPSYRRSLRQSELRKKTDPQSWDEGHSLEAFYHRLRDLCRHDGTGDGSDRAARAAHEAEQACALARELEILRQAGQTFVEAAEFEFDLFRRRAGEDPAAGAVFAEGVGHGGG